MPFRPENRFSTFLVVAVLCLCGLAVMGVRVILQYPAANATPAWVFLGASVILALKILLAMLQTEFARRDLKAEAVKTRHDLKGELHVQAMKLEEVALKTNGGLSKAIEVSGEQIRQATHDQMIDDPRCRAAIEEAIDRAAAKAADAAEARVRKVVAELKGGQA